MCTRVYTPYCIDVLPHFECRQMSEFELAAPSSRRNDFYKFLPKIFVNIYTVGSLNSKPLSIKLLSKVDLQMLSLNRIYLMQKSRNSKLFSKKGRQKKLTYAGPDCILRI